MSGIRKTRSGKILSNMSEEECSAPKRARRSIDVDDVGTSTSTLEAGNSDQGNLENSIAPDPSTTPLTTSKSSGISPNGTLGFFRSPEDVTQKTVTSISTQTETDEKWVKNIVDKNVDDSNDSGNNPFPYTDLTILIEGHKLYFSKRVLMQISPVFTAMFNSDFLEKSRSELRLPHKKYDYFVEFLRCADPNIKAPVTSENVFQVAPLADEYQVSRLKRKCEKRLIEFVETYRPRVQWRNKNPFMNESPTFQNLVRILLFAEKYNMPNLLNVSVEIASLLKMGILENRNGYSSISTETKLNIATMKIARLEKDNEKLVKKMMKYKNVMRIIH